MRYSSSVAFRRALEERLKVRAGGDSARIARDRKRIAFDRLLARLVVAAPDAWVLKGGFALDLRLADRARTTKDVDLAWLAEEEDLLDELIDAANLDLADYFTFSLERADISPDLMGGAHRFRVTASLAGRPFEAFVLDVGVHDAPGSGVELLTTPDLLAFADIEPVTVPALPLADQVAEKLHAYTRVYDAGRASTRTKDLIDLALIAHLFPLSAKEVRTSIDAVFAHRATHEPPATVPSPPAQWRAPFRRLALTLGLDDDVDAGHARVAAMLDPVLQRTVTVATWDPDTQQWISD